MTGSPDHASWLEHPRVRDQLVRKIVAALRPTVDGGTVWADELFDGTHTPFGQASLLAAGPPCDIRIGSVRAHADGSLTLGIELTQPVTISLLVLVADRALDPDEGWPYRAAPQTLAPGGAGSPTRVDLHAGLTIEVDPGRHIGTCVVERLQLPQEASLFTEGSLTPASVPTSTRSDLR